MVLERKDVDYYNSMCENGMRSFDGTLYRDLFLNYDISEVRIHLSVRVSVWILCIYSHTECIYTHILLGPFEDKSVQIYL